MSVRLTNKKVFSDILDKIESLPIEDQEILMDVVSHRHSEKRRETILKNAKKSFLKYKNGLTKEGTAEDLLKDLER